MATGESGDVRVVERRPSPALQPFIERFLVARFPSLHRDAHFPDTRPVAAFTVRGGVRLNGGMQAPRAAFSGLNGALRVHEHYDGHHVLLAMFTPAGAAAFLGPPQEALAGTTTDLADILASARDLDRLHDQLASARDDAARVHVLGDLFLARLRIQAPDLLVSAAVARLQADHGATRIHEVAREIGLSQSALERRFRRIVGVSPKKFASLARLRHAMGLRAAGADSTTVAHAAGYFDQAHFIHDFRRATGRSPDAFFRG